MSYFKRFMQPFFDDADDYSGSTSNNPDVADLDTADSNDDNDSQGNDNDDDLKDTDTGTGPEIKKEKPVQSKEENAKYAAARREAERKAAEAQARAAKLERDNAISREYSEYGVHSEEDIRTKFNMSVEEFEQAVIKRKMEDSGMDPNLIEKAMEKHPLFKKFAETNQFLEEQRKQEAVKVAFQRLHEEVPGTEHIKTVDDLATDPKIDEINFWLKKGYELSDAYYKVHKNDISTNKSKSLVQSTIANIQDRAKRGVTQTGDADDDSIPNLSEFGMGLASAMGLNPKNVAKRIKEKMKGR
jgi:hypothetical protein